ncbi:DNA internalization-related competence protein ComEC/Rec2 [Chengkuizengella sp. SCS-71B]|uniref:DNA internalization-related competence protein ComEC/Rec2 n=1 Tax=Chengkuizengella sp. SCS-71B TaxID=3115290 RepID=UPI0032C24BD7
MKQPILYIAVSWVIGAAIVFSIPTKMMFFSIIIMSLFGVLLLWKIKVPFKSILLLCLILTYSIMYHYWYHMKNVSMIDPDWEESEVKVYGTINSTIKIDGDQVSFDIKTDQLNEKLKVFIKLNTSDEKDTVKTWGRGDSIAFIGVLKAPSVARNFGAFDYRKYLYYQHIHWILSARGLDNLQVTPASFQFSFSYFLSWTDKIRSYLANQLVMIFSESHQGFMLSLLLGLRNEFDPIEFEQFSQIGLTHILAISGLHVAVFLTCCMYLLKLLGFTKEKQIYCCMCIIPFYILITGAAPSVVRAGLMAMFGLYALQNGRGKDVLNFVGFAVFLMLIWNPYYLVNVSFQLSVIVTLLLILLVPMISKLIPISSTLLNGTLSVTITAQLASFPLTIYYFNQFSFLSWLANLLLVPIVSIIILPLGLAALILSLIHIKVALLITYVIEICIDILFWFVHSINSYSKFNTIWASPTIELLLLYYILLWLSVWTLHKTNTKDDLIPVIVQDLRFVFIKKYKLAIFFNIILLLLGLFFYFPDLFDKTGLVRFIDVGQGDSIVIQTPKNKVILVDGGGTFSFTKSNEEWRNRKDPYEVGKDVVVPTLRKQGVHEIDYLIISHLDFDHIGGLIATIEKIPVNHIIFNGTLKNNETVQQLFHLANEKRIPLYKVEFGEVLKLDQYTTIHFLHPAELEELYLESEQNEQSIVFLLKMYQTKILFTGDIDQVTESAILNRLNPNQSKIDILKVAHHGSKSSSSTEWLSYWQPKAAVISVGNNNLYGHPHHDVLMNLENHNLKIYRTDIQGEIKLEIRANGWDVTTKLK